MFNNIQCEIFKQQLNKLINNSQLLPIVAYYILKDSLNELQKICNQILIQEKQQLNKTEEKNFQYKDEKTEAILDQIKNSSITIIENQDQSQD